MSNVQTIIVEAFVVIFLVVGMLAFLGDSVGGAGFLTNVGWILRGLAVVLGVLGFIFSFGWIVFDLGRRLLAL